jgi:hypothetical protein
MKRKQKHTLYPCSSSSTIITHPRLPTTTKTEALQSRSSTLSMHFHKEAEKESS